MLTKLEIIPERLAELLSGKVPLQRGSHTTRANGMCAMEWAAYLAGEPHSDQPKCVDPGIVRMMIRANDRMVDDAERARWLTDLIPLTLNTNGSLPLRVRRAYRAADWAVRWAAPYALRLVGLHEHADKLEALAPVTDRATARLAHDRAQAARDAAYASAYAAAAYSYADADAADAAADAAAYASAYAADAAAADAAATTYAAVYAAAADAAATADAAAERKASGSREAVWQSWHDLMIELCAMREV